MQRSVWLALLIAAFLSGARADESKLITYSQYKQGEPIRLHFSYGGGTNGWDASASVADGILVLSNAMFISIERSPGAPVEPIREKVLSVWTDSFMREPFELILDISRFYDLSRPGKYTVRWGCKGVTHDEVFIEITE